ncbi:ACT domain-containing protein [Rhodobacterales bacterium HKCCE3408]|nr:ACT domain-containing protein [Rhodobacterales bacterium HKCCE3408]
MTDPVSDTRAMIAGMAPHLNEAHYVYAVSEDPRLAGHAFAVIREEEGTTLILPEPLAAAEGVAGSGPMCCITLMVHSALEGVGLTAAVSGALAEANIPANVVAAFHHDHVFVPVEKAETAMEVLIALQATANA